MANQTQGDRISRIYEKAVSRGVINAQQLSEDQFRESLKDSSNVDRFYASASAGGMKLSGPDEFRKLIAHPELEREAALNYQETPTFMSKVRSLGQTVGDALKQGAPQAIKQGASLAASAVAGGLPGVVANVAGKKVADKIQDVHSEEDAARAENERQQNATLHLSPEDMEMKSRRDGLLSRIESNKKTGKSEPWYERELAELEQRMPQYLLGNDVTPQGVLMRYANAWSVNTPEGRARAEQMQREYKDVESEAVRQFKQSPEFAALLKEAQGVTDQQKRQEINARIDALFVEKYGDMLMAEKARIGSSFLKDAQAADNGYVKREQEKLANAVISKAISDNMSAINAADQKKINDFNQHVGNGAGSAEAKANYAMQVANSGYSAAARQLLWEAQTLMGDTKKGEYSLGSFTKDFARNAATKLRNLASFGFSDLESSRLQSEVLAKIADMGAYDNPEMVLEADELALFNAIVTKTAVDIMRSDNLSWAASAAKQTADMLPFVRDILIGNAVFGGLTNAAREGLIRGITRKLGQGVMGNLVADFVATNTVGVLSSAASAAILPSTLSMAYQRSAELNPNAIEINGTLHLNKGGIKTQDFGESYLQALASQTKEIFTETGGNTQVALRAIGNTPMMKALGQTSFGQLMNRLKNTGAGKLLEQTAYHGVIGEASEEFEGTFYDACYEAIKASNNGGSAKEAFGKVYGEFLDPDSLVPMLISFGAVSSIGGAAGGMQLAYQARTQRQYNQAKAAMMSAMQVCGMSEEQQQATLDDLRGALYSGAIDDLPQKIAQIASAYSADGSKENEALQVAMAAYLVADAKLGRVQMEHQEDQDNVRKMYEESLRIDDELERQVNTDDGKVHRVVSKQNPEQTGYIVSGEEAAVNENTDGTLSYVGNGVVTVAMDDGTVEQSSITNFVPTEMPAAVEEVRKNRLQHAELVIRASSMFRPGSQVEAIGPDGMPTGQSSRVVSVTDNGVEVEMVGPDGRPTTTVLPLETALQTLHPLRFDVAVGEDLTLNIGGEQQSFTYNGGGMFTAKDGSGEVTEDELMALVADGATIEGEQAPAASTEAPAAGEPAAQPEEQPAQPAAPTAAPAQEQQPSAPEKKSPKQMADELVASMGEEKARKKVQATVAAIDQRIADTQAKLDKAQQELDDMPIAFDEESAKAQEKAQKAVDNLTAIMGALQGQKAQYDGMLGEMGEKKSKSSNLAIIDKAIELAAEPYNEDEAMELVASFRKEAVNAPVVEFSKENFEKEFPGMMVETPIGQIKIGENQYDKLIKKKRTSQLGMIRPTLTQPDVVLIEYEFKKQDVERPAKLLFVKSFIIDGEKVTNFESATIRMDGLEIAISSHIINEDDFVEKLQEDGIVYNRKKPLDNSSEGHLAESSASLPDLVPSQSNGFSDGKGTTKNPNEQISEEKNAEKVQNPAENGKKEAKKPEDRAFTPEEQAEFNKALNDVREAGDRLASVSEEMDARMSLGLDTKEVEKALNNANADHQKAMEAYRKFYPRAVFVGRQVKQENIDRIKAELQEQMEKERAAKAPKAETGQPLQGTSYTIAEAAEAIRADVRNILDENGYGDVEIVDLRVIGSRTTGKAREDSDIDAVFEFKGDAREDDLFNLIADEGLTLDGIKVDVNPITAGKSGTMAEFMKRSDAYLAEKYGAEQPQQQAQGAQAKGVLEGLDVPTAYEKAVELANEGRMDEAMQLLDEATDETQDPELASLIKEDGMQEQAIKHAVKVYNQWFPEHKLQYKQAKATKKPAGGESPTTSVSRLNEYVKDMPQVKRAKIMSTLGYELHHKDLGVLTRAAYIEKRVGEGREFFVNYDNGKPYYGLYSEDKSKYTPITKIEYDYATFLGGKVTSAEDVALRKEEDRLATLNKKLEFVDDKSLNSRIEALEKHESKLNPNNYQQKQMLDQLNEMRELRDLRAKVNQRKLEAARQQVDTNPTDAQKEAGNYKKGHVSLFGFDITLENPKGSTRSGKDADGKEWSITMNNDYGYIRGTESVDGDHIDIYLGDNTASEKVFVMDAINQKTGAFDEHKVLLGFDSADAALEAYLANYEKGWKPGTLTEVSLDEFRKWIESSHRKTKPFAEYKNVKTEGEQGTPATEEKDPAYIGVEDREYVDAQEELIGIIGQEAYDKMEEQFKKDYVAKRIADQEKRADEILERGGGRFDMGDGVYDWNYFGYLLYRNPVTGKLHLDIMEKYDGKTHWNPYNTTSVEGLSIAEAKKRIYDVIEKQAQFGTVSMSYEKIQKELEAAKATHDNPTIDPRENSDGNQQESLVLKRYWNGIGSLGDDIVGKVLRDHPDVMPSNDWSKAIHTGVSTSQVYNDVAQELEWYDQTMNIGWKTHNSDVQLVMGGLRDRIMEHLPMLNAAEFDKLAAAMNVSESNLKRDNLTAMGLLHAEYLTRQEEPKYIRDLREQKNASRLAEMVRGLSERGLEKASERYPIDAVKNEVLRREGLDSDARTFDNLKKIQTMARGTAKRAVYTPSNYVVTDEPLRPVLWGVLHENGMKVTTDAHILFAYKEDYPAENEGKILLDPSLDKSFRAKVTYYSEGLPVIEGRYPNWRAVVPSKDKNTVVSKVDVKDLRNFLAGAMENLRKDWKALRSANKTVRTWNDYKRLSRVAIRFSDGEFGLYSTQYLERFADALELLGADEVFYAAYKGQKKLLAETDKGTILLTPIVGSLDENMEEPWEGAIAQDSPVNVDGDIRQFVYDLSVPQGSNTPDGGGKRARTKKEVAQEAQAERKVKTEKAKAAASTPGSFADNGVSETAKREKIEDVGEKIGGARKDILRELADRINVNGETFAQIFPKFDLPKLIEKGLDPKYAAGLKFVVDHSKGAYKAQKKRLGRGPRAEQKALDLVRFMAAYAKGFLNGDMSTEFEAHGWHFTEYGKLRYPFAIEMFQALYKEMGNDMFAIDLSQEMSDIIMTEDERKRHMEDRGEKYFPSTRTFYRDGKEFTPRYETGLGANTKYFTADEKQQAIDFFVETVKKATDYKSTHKYKLSVYYSPTKSADGKTQYFIGTKMSGQIIELTPHGTEYGLKYLQDHNEELQLAAERKAAEVKEQNKEARKIATVERRQEWNPNERRIEYFLATKIDKDWVPVSERFWPEGQRGEDYRAFLGKIEAATDAAQEKAQQLLDEYLQRKEESKGWKPEMNIGQNRPRVGVDWRAGEDVSAVKLRDTFGFRGVEFGNYVSQKERQQFINECYDALMDMAQLLDVSPRALSLNGQLGLAIGARGLGGAKAHYEPEKNVINLTKNSGWGSLAHEWWHAMDFYFGQREKTKSATQDLFSPDTRTEVQKAFARIMDVMKNSTEYGKRSQALDKFTGKKYYATPTEMGARAFQDYVVRMLTSRSQVNDFLSHYTSAEDWNGKPETYPYPVGKEGEEIAKAMLNLFDTLQEETDAATGNVRLYSRVGDSLTEAEDSQGVLTYDRGLTEAEQLATDGVMAALEEAGVTVHRISNEEADAMGDEENRQYMAEAINARFNAELQSQIDGTLEKGHVYKFGRPSSILIKAGLPDLDIELVASRLSDKSMQENHPFSLEEIKGLPNAIQHPLAVMVSATRLGSHVILTELKHGNDNFVVAVSVNKTKDKVEVNSIRSVHYRNKMNIINLIAEGLGTYYSPEMAEWIEKTKIELRSKPQYNSADVRAKLNSAAKVVKNFDLSKFLDEKMQNSGENEQISFQKVGNRSEIERLESEPTIKLYRSMQTFPDRPGEFFPPMAAVVNGEMQGQKMGEWYKSDEHPELLIPNMGKDGVQKMYDGKADNAGKPNYKFRLNKGESQVEGKKMTTVDAAYNPYFHSSTTMLNDQFAQAVDRPNMVTVEIEVPERELAGEYSAEYAKDHVGMHEWKAGPVQAKLTGTRQVMLSQYCKIVRVVPNEEVAQSIAKQLEGSDVAIPFNVLPPALRTELEKLGVAISDQDTRAGVQKRKFQRMHHNSPAKFRHFDLSHIGEGEGNQVHGYGVYLSKKNLKKYATMHTTYKVMDWPDFIYKSLTQPEIDMLLDELATIQQFYGYQYTNRKVPKTSMKKYAVDYFDRVQNGNVQTDEQKQMAGHILDYLKQHGLKELVENKGYHYDVDIPDDNGKNYLDENKPITDEQIAMIRDHAKNVEGVNDNVYLLFLGKTGREIREILSYPSLFGNDEKAISQFLNDCGFVGMRYNGTIDGEGVVIFDEKNTSIWDSYAYLRTPEGRVYGWSQNGEITLAERGVNPNTPVHEYTHLWTAAVRKKNPELWQNIKELFKDNPLVDAVRKDEQYAGLDEDGIMDEVLSRYSGKRGAERLTEAAQKLLDENPGSKKGVAMVAKFVNNIRKALNELWEWVGKNLFGIKEFKSQEEVSDRILYDLFNKTSLENGEVGAGNSGLQEFAETNAKYSASNEAAATFYSNAAAALGRIKQDKATPEQWLAMLTKEGGIKAGEDKWMGLSDWLRQSEAKTLTKGEVMQFVRDNAIQIEEVKYGGSQTGKTKALFYWDDAMTNHLTDEGVIEVGDDVFVSDNDDFGSAYIVKTTKGTYDVYIYDKKDASYDNMQDAERKVAAFYGNEVEGESLGTGERAINSTRIQYTTRGLKNKREIAMTVPTIDPWKVEDETHFGDAGNGRAVAWVRFGETVINGVDEEYERLRKETDAIENSEDPDWDLVSKNGERMIELLNNKPIKERVLVIDEIQSKRHQEGREKGYKPNYKAERNSLVEKRNELVAKIKNGSASDAEKEEELSLFNQIRELNRRIEQEQRFEYGSEKVPDAPFDKNWAELSFKRMLRLAAEEGYDRVAWTTGTQQADRYSIGGVVGSIAVSHNSDGKHIAILMKEGNVLGYTLDENGTILYDEQKGMNISEVIGKELAVKVMQSNDGDVISGDNLRIGGEGMKTFYDQMLPSFVKKYVKKWGATVEDVTLPNVEAAGRVMHSVTITPEMRESVMQGQPMFQRTGAPEFVSEEETDIDDDNLLKELRKLDEVFGNIKDEWQTSRDIVQNAAVLKSNTLRKARKDSDKDVRESMAADNVANGTVARISTRLLEMMQAQKEYDSISIHEVVRLANMMIKGGWMDNAYRREKVKVMNTIAHTSVGGYKATQADIDDLVNTLASVEVRHAEETFEKFLDYESKHHTKLSISDVAIQGRLAIRGQMMLRTYRDAMKSSKTVEELEADMEQALLESGVAASKNREDECLGKADGYLFAKQAKAGIAELKKDESRIIEDMNRVKSAPGMTPQQRKDAIHALQATLFENRAEQMKEYAKLQDFMRGNIEYGRNAAREWAKKALEDKQKVRNLGDEDLANIPDNIDVPQTKRSLVNQFRAGLLSPTNTLDTMLRYLGSYTNSAGEGALWEHFVRGFDDASVQMYEHLKADTKVLDDKASEFLGRKATWADLAKEMNKLPGATVRYFNKVSDSEHEPAIMVDHKLTQGNLAYIYAVAKMHDGRMKLNAMGISDEDIQKVVDAIDPLSKKVVDWLQDEFLVDLRKRYNEVHMRLFGAPMDEIKNYFKLYINKRATNATENLGENQIGFVNISGTSTGSIKVRTVNSKPLDLIEADAFKFPIEHIMEMDQWEAFAELVRDANVLFSDTTFKNRIKNMNTIYGNGEREFLPRLRDAFKVALGSYNPGKAQTAWMVDVAKGVTAAKVSGRIWTAIKQLTSHPAFFSYMVEDGFAKAYGNNLVHPIDSFRWGLENLPLLRKRFEKADLGDFILAERKGDAEWQKAIMRFASKYGMAPNVFIDSLTCAQGAKAVYEVRLAKYKALGMDDDVASKRARQDADVCFNKSQQSNEGAFMSPVQASKDFFTAAACAFRNSNFSYTRNFMSACTNLSKMGKYKEEQIEYMRQKYIKLGVVPELAKHEAIKDWNQDYKRNIIDIIVYGFGLNSVWALAGIGPYLLFGGDPDEKKKLIKEALWGAYYLPYKPLGMPLFGVFGGNVLDGILSGTSDPSKFFMQESPIATDLVNAWNQVKNGRITEFSVNMFNIVAQSVTGFNPATISQAMLAIYNNHETDGKQELDDVLLDLSALLNIPKNQRNMFYMDRLNKEFDRYDSFGALKRSSKYSRLRRIYIDEQIIENAPLVNNIASAEEMDKARKRYGKRFDDMCKERLAVRGKGKK